ncbi:MAG: TetR family transcriptional regulator [Xanthomonadales bacterium]|nr:TetR family transcriptional regulator [Xanthomonadales bacterium]|tara:strand:+ start:597 stop:1184 length:588 start_codon:yes stop_codon:yes gene_type:complete
MPERQSAPGRARDRLLRAASDLFYADGIAATGIDTITERAGVAKQSLYNNFPSKAALVSAYIDARHDEWLALYEVRQQASDDPVAGVIAVFDAYIDHASTAYEYGFRGCGLLNAAAELSAGDPGRAAVRRHKAQVESLLCAHLNDIYPEQPERAARIGKHLAFLLEGAIARGGLDGNANCLHAAKAIATDLLEQS